MPQDNLDWMDRSDEYTEDVLDAMCDQLYRGAITAGLISLRGPDKLGAAMRVHDGITWSCSAGGARLSKLEDALIQLQGRAVITVKTRAVDVAFAGHM